VLRDDDPVSTMQFFAIWRALVDVSGDPAIGLKIAFSLDDAVLPPSFLDAYYARDFRDALQRVARFKRLCAPEDVVVEEQEERCEITLTWTHSDGEVTPPALIDASMASLLEIGRRGTGTRLFPIRQWEDRTPSAWRAGKRLAPRQKGPDASRSARVRGHGLAPRTAPLRPASHKSSRKAAARRQI
jgi:hypothetical protein